MMSGFGFGGFDLFSTLFPIFFTIVFVFAIGTMISMPSGKTPSTRGTADLNPSTKVFSS